MTKTYTLTSVKGGREVRGTLLAAIEAAIAMEANLQPAFGLTVSRDGEIVAEVIDGAVDGRTLAAWWEWHAADSSRWAGDAAEAEDRAALWLIGESDDGPAA